MLSKLYSENFIVERSKIKLILKEEMKKGKRLYILLAIMVKGK